MERNRGPKAEWRKVAALIEREMTATLAGCLLIFLTVLVLKLTGCVIK
ncbi:hypothetical protein BH09BAC6_BH09BAC6_35110 [soil metagenome]|jgi:hypothetical protein